MLHPTKDISHVLVRGSPWLNAKAEGGGARDAPRPSRTDDSTYGAAGLLTEPAPQERLEGQLEPLLSLACRPLPCLYWQFRGWRGGRRLHHRLPLPKGRGGEDGGQEGGRGAAEGVGGGVGFRREEEEEEDPGSWQRALDRNGVQ